MLSAALFMQNKDTDLADLNQQEQDRIKRIIEQMNMIEDATEDWKSADLLAWVSRMNAIQNRAGEIVLQ